jgi:hypothetical protein
VPDPPWGTATAVRAVVAQGLRKTLNNTIEVVGGATAEASSSNVKTVVNNGKIEVQIVDAPTFAGTVTSNTGFQVAGGPSVTKDGIDAAGNKITNLANGTDAGDAVNASQLNALGQQHRIIVGRHVQL